ncbi:Tryptophan decarboxylase 2 [Podosphaera aphanis]|nr:Tryptophan decarboxylase 2 [Podosphaera aphanis]
MDKQQFKEAANAAIDEIVKYYDTVHERRTISAVEPGYLRHILPKGPPQGGESWDKIQQDIESKILPGLSHWQSPKFMGFFPASSSWPGILGELYSAAFTTPAFNWICSPAVTELETIMLDWLSELFHLPGSFLSTSADGGGVIQGSASEAIISVMVAARDKYIYETTSHLSLSELEDAIALKRSKMVVLGTDTTHSSTQKAAQILGMRYRSIPVFKENDYALTGANLDKVLLDCRAQGLEPFYLTATLGTTVTCAVDDFASIAATLQKYSPPGQLGEIWVHIDAAYAGSALVCPEFHHLTAHFHQFHSFAVNLHKWLLINIDATCLFLRKRTDLNNAMSIKRSYLTNEFSEKRNVIDYRDWQLPMGRRFRSLKIWFVLRTYGISGLQAHIRKHIGFGEFFGSLLKTRSDLFKIFAGPAFALTVFTVVSERGDHDQLTKAVYELMTKRGEIYLTSGVVDGRYIIRLVSANPLAEEQFIKRAFDLLVEATEELKKIDMEQKTLLCR